MAKRNRTPLQYMRQLDGLRTLAVMMVIFHHWTDFRTFWFSGAIGVQLFFVISGFLITGILLDARSKAEQRGVAQQDVLKSFYARRVLRIFPLFYATLAVTYLIGIDAVRDTLLWHIPYLSNVFFAIRGGFYAQVSHFWSLAVEEQFYLCWPFLVLLTPRKYLPSVMVICVLTAPLFRLSGRALGLNDVAVEVLPFASLDALGLGALFAYLDRYEWRTTRRQRDDIKKVKKLAYGIGVIGIIAVFAAGMLGPHIDGINWGEVRRMALAPALLGIVYGASKGFAGLIGKILSLGPVVYLGKISYSLYVFHFFVPHVTTTVFRSIGGDLPMVLGSSLFFLLNLGVLMIASVLSWHFFEKPINDLKRHFPYVWKSAETSPGLAVISK